MVASCLPPSSYGHVAASDQSATAACTTCRDRAPCMQRRTTRHRRPSRRPAAASPSPGRSSRTPSASALTPPSTVPPTAPRGPGPVPRHRRRPPEATPAASGLLRPHKTRLAEATRSAGAAQAAAVSMNCSSRVPHQGAAVGGCRSAVGRCCAAGGPLQHMGAGAASRIDRVHASSVGVAACP